MRAASQVLRNSMKPAALHIALWKFVLSRIIDLIEKGQAHLASSLRASSGAQALTAAADMPQTCVNIAYPKLELLMAACRSCNTKA